MKKILTLSILSLMFIFATPVFAATETGAGIKPSSFFYFFDTTFEKVNLFFTFGSENKAKKALEYADERLAEAEESANEDNAKAVEEAMAGYKKEISFATEKSKGLKDQSKAEELLNIVSENTAKHQEVLASVLEKVSEEAKQAILNAIEVSKKGQEEAVKQIAELKGEVEKLKKEVAELKARNETQTKETEEIKKQKTENTPAPTKSSAPSILETTKTTKPATAIQPQTPTKVEQTKSIKIVTLPSGSVVEMDADGNSIRTITKAEDTSPAPSNQPKASAVSGRELESALTKLYIQSNFDFVRSSLSSLLNVAHAQRNSYNAISKSSSNSCSQYDQAIEDAKQDGALELTQYYESRSGFASSPGIEKGIKDKTSNRIQQLTDSKNSCLASTPTVDASLSQQIDHAVSRISSLSARVSANKNSTYEMSSIIKEYNSIQQLLISINYSIPSPASFSAQKVSSPGSFSCSSGASGTGSYSCIDYGSGVSTYCSTSGGSSFNCTNSNTKSVYCRANAIGTGVDCSY